jgi:stearoyl-CoA desaturase (delta-9 desaturase)
MIELIYLLVCTHITIVCVTLFLHRGQAHRGIEFHPIVEHFMRFWLWLTTGMVTKEWVAVHRKHHANTDKENDPHSPHNEGLLRMMYGGAALYTKAAQDKTMVESYGKGTPDDWMEKNVYSKYSKLGFITLLIFNTLLFNGWGIVIWLIQMAWIPFWAAGVVNGVGHYFGYRNWNTKDKSTNIVPLGIIIGGEELHNNHHNSPADVKLSNKWYEFDIGWMWLSILKFLRLAK